MLPLLTIGKGKRNRRVSRLRIMTDVPIVRFSERAVKKIRALVPSGEDAPRIRLSAERSHCMGGRGHSYGLAVAERESDDDVVVESSGLTFLISPPSARLLAGAEVDHVETLQESGFKFSNPNATGKCPCGHHDLFD